MIRTFETHKIRAQKELTGAGWEFTPCQGEHAGRVYPVVTPCCWESHPDFLKYRGEGIYKTCFSAAGNIRLEFKGVSHTATVLLDGKEIAHHYNAYTSFETIVKDLMPGEHILEIKADNRFSEASALHVPNDYMSYGGVSRPVVLEQIADVLIRRLQVTPYTEQGQWKAEFKLVLQNIDTAEHRVEAVTRCADREINWGSTALAAGEEKTLTTVASFAQVKEWNMETPELYYASTVLYKNGEAVDDFIDRFGFREVKTEGKKLLFNGRPLRIKGLCRHEDHPQFACALPYAAIQADIDLIKHLGANSIRAVHYPTDEVFLDLCDEQGILVWEENHARGLSLEQMQNANFESQAEQCIREMLPLHYNHPCIYIWGILNECASDSQYGRECYSRQYDLIKELDTSRPRSSASCKFKTDICFDLPEVVSYNIYPRWYHDTNVREYLDELYQWIQRETGGKGKPFLITEIGAGGIYGYRNPVADKWTEDYQAETVREQITACLEYPDCSGVYIWQFCDVRISEEWWFGRPRTMNNKGIVDEYRRRKQSYNVVKSIYESYGNYFEE